MDEKIYKGLRCSSVAINKFSQIEGTNLLKTKNAQTVKDLVNNILKTSKTQPNFIETGDTKKIVEKILLIPQRKLLLEEIVAIHQKLQLLLTKLMEPLEIFFQKPIFEKGMGIWIDGKHT